MEIKAASLLEEKPVVLEKPMVLDKGNNDEVFNALPIEDYDIDYEGSGLWGPDKFNLLILETLNLKNLLLAPMLFFNWTYQGR